MVGTLPFNSLGTGPAILLIHGMAEDAGMLEPQARSFADHGRRAVWYDRRGTGSTDRTSWPEGGVAVHADDAAAIVAALGEKVQVLGLSSGGVIAMELARRRPDLDLDVVAWEPAALAAPAGGLDLHAASMKPVELYLEDHPDDWGGAFGVLLGITSGGRADLGSPVVKAKMRNAEPAVRDDAPLITRHEFERGSVPKGRVRLAVSREIGGMHGRVVESLVAAHGLETFVVNGTTDHDVYLNSPQVLARANWDPR